jgi:hypothetical protein
MRLTPLFLVSICLHLSADDFVPADQALADNLFREHYARLVVFWSGQCPRAAEMMRTIIKDLHDQIEADHLPAVLMCVTPDKKPAELRAYAKSLGMEQALFFYDPANTRNISLNNIIQMSCCGGDGKAFQINPAKLVEDMKNLKTKGTYRYPVAGLTDEKMMAAWWMVERGRPGAIRSLVAAAKKNPDPAGEVARIHAAVKKAVDAWQEEFVAMAPSIDAVDKLEWLLREADGMDLAAVKKRLDEVKRDPSLKVELAARDAYLKCDTLSCSDKTIDQKNAMTGFAQIAKKHPDTVYGKKAATRLGSP